jgi:hypothetical protein
MGLDGRSGFAELGYSTPTRFSPTTAVQTHRDDAVIENEEEQEEEEEEQEDGFVIER